MWNNYLESARDPIVRAVGMEGGRSQEKGPKLSPERCFVFWGQRKRSEEIEKKVHKGGTETIRE